MLSKLTKKDLVSINKSLGETGEAKDPSQGVGSALASYHYYDTVEEQILSIALSICNGHLFVNGNKRTALTLIRVLARHYGLTMQPDSKQFKAIIELATKGGSPKKYINKFFIKETQ